MARPEAYLDVTIVPRVAVELPLALPLPDGFVPDRRETWPALPGRLEFVQGRLLYMPPSGDLHQETAVDVSTELNLWRRGHAEFVVGGNEAGMVLGGEVRAADVAIWKRSAVGEDTGGFRRAPPVLAVEIAGPDDSVDSLRGKADWYLGHGVEVVWILSPADRAVHIVTPSGTRKLGVADSTPDHPALPGLAPRVADLFRQISD